MFAFQKYSANDYSAYWGIFDVPVGGIDFFMILRDELHLLHLFWACTTLASLPLILQPLVAESTKVRTRPQHILFLVLVFSI